MNHLKFRATPYDILMKKHKLISHVNTVVVILTCMRRETDRLKIRTSHRRYCCPNLKTDDNLKKSQRSPIETISCNSNRSPC